MVQKVASKVVIKVPEPNFREPTAVKSSAIGAFPPNLATLLQDELNFSMAEKLKLKNKNKH